MDALSRNPAAEIRRGEWRKWGRCIGIAPVLLLLALVLPVPRSGGSRIAGLPPLCLFQRLWEIPCPGCGITRSVVCAAHGNWADAVQFHPLGPGVFAALLVVSVTRLSGLRPAWQRQTEWLACAGVAALLLVWLARLAGYLPAPP